MTTSATASAHRKNCPHGYTLQPCSICSPGHYHEEMQVKAGPYRTPQRIVRLDRIELGKAFADHAVVWDDGTERKLTELDRDTLIRLVLDMAS